ncbi:MAG TPA: TolC family protein, partial [Coleofasciculaceae cyanobacterium]
AIALSCIKPSACQEIPSLAQPKRDQAERSDTQPNVTPSSQDSQEAVETKQKDTPTIVVEASATVESSITSAQEQPQEVESSASSNEPSEDAQDAKPSTDIVVETSVPPSRQQDSVGQLPDFSSPESASGAEDNSVIERLNPSANPLLFPTQPEEVQIQRTQPISLEQAVELAGRNNQELQRAQLTLERNRYALREALAAEFPSGNVNLDFTRQDSASQELTNQGRANNPLLADNDDTISTSFSTTLEITYNLYTAGRRPAQIRAAEEQVRLQQLEVERISEQLRLDVATNYYDLQEADAQVEIAQAAVTEATQSLRDAQLLEQAGLGTRFDVLQQQVQLANNNQDLTRAISQLRIARRQLAQLLNLPQTAEISAADPIEAAGDWELPLEQSIILALKNRAELEQQLVQRNINEQQRRIALAAIRPQASLFANYNILSVLDDDFGPADGFSLGARLRWNFFDAGAARARARQEEANIAIAENRFDEQRNQVRFDVEQAFFQLNANRENIQTANLALQQAQESLRLARLRFQAGVGTQTDVINQQTELTRARVNRLRAILDYNRALAALQRAVSNLPEGILFDLPSRQ